jgi:hypothetical protein
VKWTELVGFCEHCDETLGAVKQLDLLNKYKLLKEAPALWS